MTSHWPLRVCLLAFATLLPSRAAAQFLRDVPLTRPRPDLGIGVDTLPTQAWGVPWKGRSAEIYGRWAEFLASLRPRYTTPGMPLSPYWLAEEQKRWLAFPIAFGLVGATGLTTVLDIRPASPGSDSVYVVKTLFSTSDARRQPTSLLRVYAVREGNEWVFSNALPRTTRGWMHVTVGPFIYIMPPAYAFNRARAQMAAAFADSLARAFDVPAVRAVDYYLTESPDEMNRIVGVDWLPSSSDGGAFSSAADHLLISGNPAVGENYRHEIVHLVLDPIGRKGVHSLLWEGVATWLGGTLGMSASQTRLAYASYLRAHPDVTLEGILHESIDRGFRPAGSVLIQMAFQRGGTSAVKTLLGGGFTDEALIASLERLFGMPWAAVQAQWRREALR